MILRIKTDSEKRACKNPSSQTCGITQCPATPGLSSCLAAGAELGGGSPASIHSMQTLGLGSSRRCTFAAEKQCLGRGRDSSGVAVDVFMHE